MAYTSVLMIDDDEDDQEIFQMALERTSANLIFNALSSPVEALSQLEEGRLNPEIIFLDLNMPFMNGHEFLAQIKKHPRLKAIPIVIFSTTKNPDTIRQTMVAGAAHFITKPHKLNELVIELKQFFK